MPAMMDTGYDYVAGSGRGYPITARNGLLFVHDPRHELTVERRSVLAALAGAGTRRRPGLGAVPAGVISAVSSAAAFIPVVGPLLSGAISVLGGLFGGGDPTALSILIDQVVQLREQIAEANRSIGVADTFTVPAGFNATDKNTWRSFVDGIVEQVLGVTEDAIQSNRRPDMYSAIDALKRELATVQQQAQAVQLQQTIQADVAAATGTDTSSNLLPAGNTATQSTSAGQGTPAPSSIVPWLVAGGVAAYFLLGDRR